MKIRLVDGWQGSWKWLSMIGAFMQAVLGLLWAFANGVDWSIVAPAIGEFVPTMTPERVAAFVSVMSGLIGAGRLINQQPNEPMSFSQVDQK